MNIEGDDSEESDYGVFGDINCRPIIPSPLSARELAERSRFSKKREAESSVSRDFNSYMIELFNRK